MNNMALGIALGMFLGMIIGVLVMVLNSISKECEWREEYAQLKIERNEALKELRRVRNEKSVEESTL